MGISIRQDDLIYPYFVVSGSRRKEIIESFPGVFRFSVDLLVKDIEGLVSLGVNKILLFGVPDRKDALGSEAYGSRSIVASAVREIKKRFPKLIVMTDVCLCAYTTYGHCGVPRNRRAGLNLPYYGRRRDAVKIDNLTTLKTLSKIALSHAEAGADYVAPSAMAKRQAAAIRQALDKEDYKKTKIMGYSAKFASNFYGPFRNAAGSSPKFGDRRSYQLDFTDAEAALREIEDDINEGADIVMVKPALAYLDIIRQAKDRFGFPLAAYNVSGEYAMVKSNIRTTHNAQRTTRLENSMVLEILTAIKRAGADYIITYHAKDAARWIRDI